MLGDDQAFETLHRRLANGLRGFLQRRLRGTTDLIEDLCQATWVEVWRALIEHRYDPDRARITTFVYAVGYKVLLRHIRNERRRGANPISDEDLPEPQANDPPAPTALHVAELLEALRQCLQSNARETSLSDEERAVVLGLTLGDSERTLASQLKLAASTIHSRKQNALRKLQKCLHQKGFQNEFIERITNIRGQ